MTVTVELDAQYRQLRDECGVLARDRGVIAVTGPDGAEYLQREHALRCRGVYRISQRSEMYALRRQILDHGKQMADGARQAIEANHD